jgi:hypothetical protein
MYVIDSMQIIKNFGREICHFLSLSMASADNPSIEPFLFIMVAEECCEIKIFTACTGHEL